MVENNKFLLLCSTLNKIKKAKTTGILSMKEIYLISIIDYLTDCDSCLSFKDDQKLKSLANNIKKLNKLNYRKKNLNVFSNIRMCKNCDAPNSYDINSNNGTIPFVNDNNSLVQFNEYQFKYEDFTKDFNSFGTGLPKFVKIESLPTTGVIKYNNEVIEIGFTFDLININNLIYSLEGISIPSINLDITFKTSNNNNNNTIFSNMAIFTLNVEEFINQPPSSVGNNSITLPNASVYTFTGADFTTNTTPAYSDPENDPVAFVRILTIPVEGDLILNGVQVNINQQIPFSQIQSGLLTYESSTNASAYSSVFTFEISDTGSNTFVG